MAPKPTAQGCMYVHACFFTYVFRKKHGESNEPSQKVPQAGRRFLCNYQHGHIVFCDIIIIRHQTYNSIREKMPLLNSMSIAVSTNATTFKRFVLQSLQLLHGHAGHQRCIKNKLNYACIVNWRCKWIYEPPACDAHGRPLSAHKTTLIHQKRINQIKLNPIFGDKKYVHGFTN